ARAQDELRELGPRQRRGAGPGADLHHPRALALVRERAAEPASMKRRRLVLSITLTAYGALLAVPDAMLPSRWRLSTELMTANQLLAFPPKSLPDPATLLSYVQVWEQSNLPIYFRNSVIVTVASLVVALIVSVHAAYAMARFRFRGKNVVMLGLL